MAKKDIYSYSVRHHVGGTTAIKLQYKDGTTETISELAVEHARFMVNVLRNHAPVYYDPEIHGLTWPTAPTGGGGVDD